MIKTAVLLLLSAILLATSSCAVQRQGPDQAIYCSLGKSLDGFDILCPKPVLNGGWPAPFLYDQPGISIENRISVLEDDFRIEPFVADVAFYLLLVLGIRWLVGRRR